jgi:hypothetical protein
VPDKLADEDDNDTDVPGLLRALGAVRWLMAIVVILGVVFLGQVAAWNGGYEIAALAGGIAAFVAALSYFLFAARGTEEK